MNISSRMKKIESRVSDKFGKKLVFIDEIDGKFYVNKNGKDEETTMPENDPNTTYIIVKYYPPFSENL